MSSVRVESRLSRLDAALAAVAEGLAETQEEIRKLVHENRKRQAELDAILTRAEADTAAFKAEVRADTAAFKAEVRADTAAFKAEVRADTAAFKEENRKRYAELDAILTRAEADTAAFKAEVRADTAAFKAEVRAETEKFSAEVRAHIEESVASRKNSEREWANFKKQLGELSNKFGTLVEDIVVPSLPALMQEVFGLAMRPEGAPRFRRHSSKDKAREREFDMVLWSEEILLICEVKSTPHPEDIAKFVGVLGEARDFFPEHAQRKLYGAFASFYVDPSLVVHGERKGLLMLGLGGGLLEPLNSKGFRPKEF